IRSLYPGCRLAVADRRARAPAARRQQHAGVRDRRHARHRGPRHQRAARPRHHAAADRAAHSGRPGPPRRCEAAARRPAAGESVRRKREAPMHDVPGSHWHEPTAGKRAGFGKFGRPKTPYDLFIESEGIPIFRDIGVSKVQNLPLAPWKRMGGRGTYIQLYGTEGKWGSYVVEVPGAGALNAEKHMYEEIYYVVEGRGTTEVWLDKDSKRHVFEWQKGSLFSIPVNAWHRIVNASSAPALLLG